MCPLLTFPQEPWNQEHFEDLLAKWVAACDQPFAAVDAPEFRELLQYTHLPARRKLKIPHAQSVKLRIDKMSEEMVEGLTEMFKVCCTRPTIQRDLNR